MKSSGTTFLDRFLSNTKRERCFNIGSAVPFLLTCFFVAFIFSFFLLYSPNPLTLIPDKPFHHPHKQHHHHASTKLTSPKPQNEQKKACDLFKGNWVRAPRESSYYTNWSCTLIPDSKNCLKHGREDSDFLNWKWKPDECDLDSFNPKTFLHLARGKKLAFIGDSVSRNHMDSLVCLLSQEETPDEICKDPEDRYRKWHFPKSNFTVMSIWSRFLIVGEERMVNGTGTNIFDMHIDKVDPDWGNVVPELDYAIISAGHWFFRVMYLHDADNLVGCVFCKQPNVTDYDIDFALRMAFRAAFNFFNNCENCKKTLVFARTFAPAHFENGVWNTGGYCNRTSPMSEAEVDWKSFEWKLRNVQMEEFERGARQGDESKRYEVVDVTRAMMMRPDGHPGEHWGNKWMSGYNDCTHWCMPGPVDFWSELLLALLIQREPSSTS
ncbi:xyloglucan O-acetyltransferase 3-like [Prosopis cineraria]|uniref:xyloglucan O-acetyltransferase 3-like n=1 Tax=Prosopis cineraria TaxID=364024 RepID=UPI0024109862|nr:xyloglucan O-acetyltransferase 3-like [Prosopis cineraria]